MQLKNSKCMLQKLIYLKSEMAKSKMIKPLKPFSITKSKVDQNQEIRDFGKIMFTFA